ncbi:hypothetical protein A79E_1789 [Klebsiella pneumoniae subsp. pneumoniae 1084]|nr:hypothetical protein A79E_1789 [Klebsiella pneumoniae subsp. pneumoniae 1084]
MKNKEDVVDNKTQVAEDFIDNTSGKLKTKENTVLEDYRECH